MKIWLYYTFQTTQYTFIELPEKMDKQTKDEANVMRTVLSILWKEGLVEISIQGT